VRLFVSADLPSSVVDALVAWRPRRDELRAVSPESLHLTLAFLGERSAQDAAVVAAVVRAVARPVGGLSLGGARWLPPRRPRVLAVELADARGELEALQREVVAGLTSAIGFAPERRAFLPHVTVARVRSGARVRTGDLDGVGGVGTFGVEALALMRSVLSGGPARYEALERVAL
jgi:2'-5' RNA ligase